MGVGQAGKEIAKSEEGAGEEGEFVGAEIVADVTKDGDTICVKYGVNAVTR